jgi:hypothetical protein
LYVPFIPTRLALCEGFPILPSVSEPNAAIDRPSATDTPLPDDDDDDVFLSYKLQRVDATKSILYTLPYRPAKKV